MTALRPGILLLAAAALLGCTQNGTSRRAASPTPAETAAPAPTGEPVVPQGYRSVEWGTSKEAIQQALPMLKEAEGGNPLHRPIEHAGLPAREAYFFDDADALKEVEIRISPKVSAQKAAELALAMDAKFGPHDVTRADETRYQFAWIGADTEIYFTYDVTDNVPDAPLINYVYRAPEPVASETPAVITPTQRFVDDVLAALVEGWYLVDVVTGRHRFTWIWAHGSERRKITFSLDPSTGQLLTYEVELYAGTTPGRRQADAERALKLRLATIGGPAIVFFVPKRGADRTAYIVFEDGSYMALKPGAENILVEAGGQLPVGIPTPGP